MLKKCSKCKELKSEADFVRRQAKRDGLSSWCKQCLSIYNKNRQQDTTYRDRQRAWHRENKKKHRQEPEFQKREKLQRILYAHRRRARDNDTGGAFTGEEWSKLCNQYDNLCLRCGIKAKDTPEGKLTPDHIIPIAKGGSSQISNIQPLCRQCNRIKHTKIIDYRPYIPKWIELKLF